jgi:hypothetical protein
MHCPRTLIIPSLFVVALSDEERVQRSFSYSTNLSVTPQRYYHEQPLSRPFFDSGIKTVADVPITGTSAAYLAENAVDIPEFGTSATLHRSQK